MAETFDYEVGDVAEITAEFRDKAGNLVDPTTVVFIVKNPAGQETKKTWPADGAGLRSALGQFAAPFDVLAGGVHSWRVRGTGVVKAAAVGTFSVAPQEFSE